MTATGTKGRLLKVLEEMELLASEILEDFSSPKGARLSQAEQLTLFEVLAMRDGDLKALLRQARQQEKVEEIIDALQEQVDRQDRDIHTLQSNLKEAENLLATAIYQARQKLASIDKASETPVSSEELIRYAHRISAPSAVAAPHNWQQGDPRRPYPTDIEMRQGFLGRLSDLPLPPGPPSASAGYDGTGSMAGTPTGAGGSGFAWQVGGTQDAKPHLSSLSGLSGAQSGSIDAKNNEDVEVMSTDSSSSSSSDSQ